MGHLTWDSDALATPPIRVHGGVEIITLLAPMRVTTGIDNSGTIREEVDPSFTLDQGDPGDPGDQEGGTNLEVSTPQVESRATSIRPC